MRSAPPHVSARRLYLHVGLPKTGTTSLQERLAAASTGGAGATFAYYPERGRPEGFPGHHNVAYEVAGDARFAPASGGWRDVREELPPERDTVLSSEELFNVFLNHPERGVRWLREVAAEREVHVVVSVRSYPDYLDALYTLHLRALASAAGPEPFFRSQQRAIPRVANTLMLLLAEVGASQMHVIRHDRTRDVWTDFAAVLGEAAPPVAAPPEGAEVNARIGLDQAVALLQLARYDAVRRRPWLDRAVFSKMLLERVPPGSARYTFLSPALAEAISREASVAFRYLDACLGTEIAGMHRPTDHAYADPADPSLATPELLRVVAEFARSAGVSRDDGPTQPETVRLRHE